MKKFGNKFIASFVSIALLTTTVSFAVPAEPPSGGTGGGPSGQQSSSASVSYTGSTTFSTDTTEENMTYFSTTGSENALLVSGGTSTITDSTITKSGDSDGDNADFYGTNAAVLVYNGATLNIKDATIATNGGHANAVFAYGTGTINISDSDIETSSNNSGGIMVTGGGTLNATDLSVKTSGNSSAAIRSDRGGGDLSVEGGTYVTNGVGSPAIYSTANINVKKATLKSTASEGVVVEGANSVALENVNLTDTNTTLNGNSETYKNIFLYQSMSGDASEGTASFTAKNSNIVTNKGDTIFVTNTTATIDLENNNVTNTDGDFIRIQTGKWGNSGSNGGTVTLNMTNQKVKGNVIVDSISILDLTMENGSVIVGAIDTDNQAKNISVKLSSDSILALTADTYIDSLSNDDTSNSNIYSNGGYKLFVNGNEVSINQATFDDDSIENDIKTEIATSTPSATTETSENTGDNNNNNLVIYIAIGVAVIAVIAIIIVLFVLKGKRKNIK